MSRRIEFRRNDYPDSEAMPLHSLFITAFVVGLSGALMPGPLLAVTISSVARNGFWAGPALVLGHALAEIITVVALSRGLGKVVARPKVLALVGILGGAFLGWMSYGLLTSSGEVLSLEAKDHGSAGFGLSAVGSGLLVSVSNPYWLVWWATVGASYVALSLRQGRKGLYTFYAGHTLSDALWYVAISVAVAQGSRLISTEAYRVVLLVCGLALAVLAVYFAVSGIRSLVRKRPLVPEKAQPDKT